MKQGWEYKKLGEVCCPKNNILKATKCFETSDKILYIDISSIDNTIQKMTDVTSVTFGDAPSRAQQKVEYGDIIVSTVRPNLKNIAIIDRYESNLVASSGFCVLRNTELVERNYLFHYITSDLFTQHLMKLTTGANYPAVRDKDVRDSIIPLPPKTTQLSIISELDKINELIRLKKEQLKDYDNLAQSIFYEMFGDPVENEKGWEVKKWKDVFNTILGKMLDKSKQINHLTQYKYLANMNVQWGYFDLKELRSMTFTDEELAKYELRNNDLLICEGGDAGRCAIWKETDETILFQKAIHRARLIDTNNADVVYIRYWMQFYKVNKGLKDYISKSTIEHLTGDKLKRLPIPLPPLPLQHLFAQRIEQIERQKSAVQKSITDLETLLASRMQYWFE